MSFRSFDLYNLVKDFGEPVTLRKQSNAGTYDPSTGTVTGSTTTDYTVTAYFYNYDNGIIANVDEIRRGTRKCVISALGVDVDPDDEDQLLGNGDTVNIISVTTIFSNGNKLCFLCDVRE
ncbi:hypothetical protein GWO13_09460 [Candidatus Bathyarchaeota archaeon]|nr:hypothetical protein [Candidatus Bathyarchaeota archaeon]